MRKLAYALILFVGFALVPTMAHAQSTIAGVVRDTSGAVLPGVTVEATSPVLIEKVRTGITDGTGQYRIPELLPGLYTLTFTLTGFTTVKREAVEVSGVGVITINAELRVASIEETIVVTGETPVVDIQSTRRSQVLDDSIVQAIPATRGYNAILTAIPAVTGGSQQIDMTPTMRIFTSHGGRGNEGRVQVDGLNVGAAFNGGGVSGYIMDTSNAQELQFTLSGGLGEAEVGGINLNIIPKTGGNTFSGQIFGAAAGEWSQGSNLDDQLRAFGISEPPAILKNWDLSGSIGGPIARDKLWFLFNARNFGESSVIAGAFANKNAGDPTKWTYEADRSVQGRNENMQTIASIRLTAQLTERNKVGVYVDQQFVCQGSPVTVGAGGNYCRDRGTDWVATQGFFGANFSPEAVTTAQDSYQRVIQATWSSPVTSKLLLDAGFSSYVSRWGWMKTPGSITDLVPVTELAPFRVYRGLDNYFNNWQSPNVWRAAASYVTGAHSMKFGYQGAYLIEEIKDFANDTQTTYTFLGGRPLSLSMRIAPWEINNRTAYHAFYAQDQWTMGRLTLQGALRYDHAYSWFPAEGNGIAGPSRFNAAAITFPRAEGVKGYDDITPRVGMAYDIFGDGKTSLRVNLGKYLQSANNQENYTISNPALDGRNGRRGPTFQTTTNRTWGDTNGNFIPDCDLLNPAQNGECGPWQSQNFGNANALTTFNPDVLQGWGTRPYDWQFGVSLQREIVPRISVEAGYHRRWFGGFFVYDNVLLGADDFDSITIAAPAHPELPNGGGDPVTFLTLKPGRTANVQNRYTFASDFGGSDPTVYWHGVDVTVNARLQNGMVFQGGTSTGRGVRDYCTIAAALPEFYNTALTNPAQNIQTQAFQQTNDCKIAEKWLTQFRGLASYSIPKIDVLVSAVLQFKPNASTGPTDTTVGTNGTSLAANYQVTNAQVQAAIGRSLAVGTTTTVNLVPGGQLFAERINQVDLRAAKIIRLGRTRTTVGFDLYNLFNANPGIAFNQTFNPAITTGIGSWLQPTQILNARFVRFNATVDF